MLLLCRNAVKTSTQAKQSEIRLAKDSGLPGLCGCLRLCDHQRNTDFVRPPVKTMNHVGLIYTALNTHFSRMLLGVSSVAQLSETLDYWRNLETYDYGDVWAALYRLR